ncbi:hypothetical protein FE257_009187 [Aspergillus nanangensis]|uniref:Uncharacterized protein n=1 Tax=Aspergillus nanangensis TaxID=2582783 RepID=A0AAD4GT03_ASPNN|nr:hypothetical protein FE257_009187 [Aspergillus nanangensis]
MPTSSTSSPVKRPGLGRRAVSSHAVVTRSSTQSDLTDQKPRPHRAHIVGGHRTHHRNPSAKNLNLNKLQRHFSALAITTESSSARHHQRKKSAPTTPAAVTPAASPGSHHHVRWDGDLDQPHQSPASMKKNYSSPALRRYSSGALGKKNLVTSRPQTSSGKKKTVGFELADSDNDDGEWEDTTQSPESTRRSSVAQSRDSVENTAVLVDPLTFVKRPYPQFPRATSLPESTSKSFGEGHESDGSDDNGGSDDDNDTRPQSPESDNQPEETNRPQDHGDIATRLLSPSHSAKAPPAMSSISATAKPTMLDPGSRQTSLTNLNLASASHDGSRRPASLSNSILPNTPGTFPNATSSSIEGGVSRFIKNSFPSTSRTDSNPNTPSSFLPHYRPRTPPSPGRSSAARNPRASPPSRPPGSEPASRTQQKLWLQRTAALNTSPPDNHGASTTSSPSTMDPTFLAANQRPGAGHFDSGRGLVNGSARPGATLHDNETKHIRKVYEKTALELTVVRRFQSPTADSFKRLNTIINGGKSTASSHDRQTSSLGKPVKSAPALTDLQDGKRPGRDSSEPKQLLSRKQSNIHPSAPQAYLQDPDELVSDAADSTRPKSQHPSHRILSTSDDGIHGHAATDDDPDRPSLTDTDENAMMVRRMWESREVAIAG